ncbi:MAG TPA: hypothetical protein ACFYD6_08745 [Candidatus Brocadiia bacterium]|nr:hypothetical protein [Candidatus Brocadiales bacterium]
MKKISSHQKDGGLTKKFKVILGIVVGINIIAIVFFLIWITINLNSVFSNLGL